jgi:hypothetical protein
MVSHGESRRDSCLARGVLDLAIGSSGWLGVNRPKPPLPKLINRTSIISSTLINPATLSKTFLKRQRLRALDPKTSPYQPWKNDYQTRNAVAETTSLTAASGGNPGTSYRGSPLDITNITWQPYLVRHEQRIAAIHGSTDKRLNGSPEVTPARISGIAIRQRPTAVRR